MSPVSLDYTPIDTQHQLQDFYDVHRGVDWMGFDTEFIGEKRYNTLLCLIQISSVHGYYLLDPLSVDNIALFVKLIEDPGIVKITHAGDNDYRLLYRAYGIVPANVFDTQVAASFIGHRYPTSFAKLVEAELGEKVGKGYAVTDWSRRPMSEKQIKYALYDVVYLRQLYDTITAKLDRNGRLDWALEECDLMTEADYYYRDPNHEFLNSNLARSSRSKERLFLMRLFEWRRAEAEKRNYSKEMILPSKIFGQLVRSVKGGRESMLENRRLPTKTVHRHGELFIDLYNAPGTAEEIAVVKSVQRGSQEEEDDDMIIELLYLLMKYRANEADISHALVMPRNAIKRMKQEASVRKTILGSGWRRDLLGDDFVDWLKHFDRLKLSIEGGSIKIRVADHD